jgi:hypothetical protein
LNTPEPIRREVRVAKKKRAIAVFARPAAAPPQLGAIICARVAPLGKNSRAIAEARASPSPDLYCCAWRQASVPAGSMSPNQTTAGTGARRHDLPI